MEANRAGRWQVDNREMTSAVKFLDQQGTLAASRLKPDEVAKFVL
jgi:post-segregation antitoxin (ccd killing protein)